MVTVAVRAAECAGEPRRHWWASTSPCWTLATFVIGSINPPRIIRRTLKAVSSRPDPVSEKWT